MYCRQWSRPDSSWSHSCSSRPENRARVAAFPSSILRTPSSTSAGVGAGLEGSRAVARPPTCSPGAHRARAGGTTVSGMARAMVRVSRWCTTVSCTAWNTLMMEGFSLWLASTTAGSREQKVDQLCLMSRDLPLGPRMR